MDTIVVHPATNKLLELLRADLPQSLLLSGQRGVGLYTVAQSVAGRELAAKLAPQDAKGNPDENGTISVEMIRRLYEQTRAKQTARQVVIIDDADRMSHGAQSAFLKLLEEPGTHTCFILTSHVPDRLLTTVRSRLQHLHVRPATAEQTDEFITHLGISDTTKRTQLHYLAEGLPAELSRLVTDDETFSQRAAVIGDARTLLQGTPYEKSLVIQKYRSDRSAALRLVDSAIAIVRRTLSTKPQQALVGQLEQLLEIRENIASNYSAALQLMRFVL
ncbi:MAG TPA: AAA family ATPase [Candidatus Saccharimonadales bacterium]|nr:AAA family ATPase [Candidatus Saccharimonadales bacterium]